MRLILNRLKLRLYPIRVSGTCEGSSSIQV